MVDLYATLEQQRVQALKAVWKTRLTSILLVPLVILPVTILVLTMVHEQLSGTFAEIAASVVPAIQEQMNLVMVVCIGWVALGGWLLKRYYRTHGQQPAWDYLSNYKTKVFAQLCDEHFPGLKYDPKGAVGYDEFDGMRLFPYASDWYRSEDFFFGRHGQTKVHFAEVHAKRERSHYSEGRMRKYDETFFQGLVFVADFHKHFHCNARLIPAAEKMPKIRSQKPVILEDPNFEDCFQTVASDQTDIRYLLSTSMMQRFLRLNKRFNGLRALFASDRLTLVLPDPRDHFEPSLYQQANSPSQIDGLVRDIQVLLDIVDELDLNTRIWSKA